MPEAANDAAWITGFVIGGAVVVVVVLVVGTILYLAAGIRRLAVAILAALKDARDNTTGLWEIQATNQVLQDLLDDARRARAALGG